MFRATTKDGKVVEGYYKYHPYYEIHLICVFRKNEQLDGGGCWREYEIIPSTLAQDTTVKDKNGTPIYGSFPVEGKMSEGGDRYKDSFGVGVIVWENECGSWGKKPDGHAGILVGLVGCHLEVIGSQAEESK